MNVLLIHGVNTNEDATPDPYSYWQTAIQNGLTGAGYTDKINFTELEYNDIFDQHPVNVLIAGAAVVELVASVIANAVPMARAGVMAAPPQPSDDFMSELRWTAGMVAQWVVESDLRAACCDAIDEQINKSKPDIIFAHSLGTLLTYDFLVNDPRGKTAFNNGTLITFGTQIGNTFVKDKMWGGNVGPVNVKMWYNLYNPNDPVFVAPANVTANNFQQWTTVFGESFFDLTAHDVTVLPTCSHPGYLDNSTTVKNLWPALAGGTMAKLIARNIQIMKRATQTSSPVAAMMLNTALARSGVRHKVKHTYKYHPPRADHPLLKLAKKAPTPAKTVKLAPMVDLRKYCLPIRDQGQEGACSGFSTAAFREASHAVAAGALLTDYLSPAYLYARTRIEDGTFPQDSGASIADEFLILQNFGVCPEAVLAYTADPSEGPTSAADVSAVPYRFPDPLQVNFNAAQAIKAALVANQTITIGFTVYESFENTGSDGAVPMPNTATEKILGGHGVLVCGYDDTKKWWIVRNQWGADWGDQGYCYMPYGYEAYWNEAWTGEAEA